MKTNKFTIKKLHERYPDDTACLEEMFRMHHGDKSKCPDCGQDAKFYRIKNRRCYSCEHCGYHIYPLAKTIFHKSPTSLKNWFYAIYLFSVSKNGVSAKELERHIGVTYKCAWRMAKQIRKLFEQSNELLTDTVEVDETYVGGVGRGKRGRGTDKTPVVGMVQRGANVHVRVTENVKSSTVIPLIRDHVEIGTRMITDEYNIYGTLKHHGYPHDRIQHSSKEYVRGDVHTNTIEGFWSQLKRGISGTYHSVSPMYLQTYVDEFAYRYNQRNASSPLFETLVCSALKPV